MTRVLVVGHGSIGSRHAANLQKFEEVQVLVQDIDQERLPESEGFATTTDFETALDWHPDAVVICTPPSTHLELAHAALDRRTHVFIEKPLSHTADGVGGFVERAASIDRVVFVGCNMRFHPPVARIRNLLKKGAIGRVRFLRLRYGNYLPNWRPSDYTESYSAQASAGGGIIFDAIHELDLVREWMVEPEGVYCWAGQLGDLRIDVEDTAEVVVRGAAGQTAQVHLDYLRFERARTYELLGSDGLIRWTARGKNPERSTVGYYDPEAESWDEMEYESDLNEMYVAEMDHFLACLNGKVRPEVDARGGWDALRLALSAKDSAQTRCEEPVHLDAS